MFYKALTRKKVELLLGERLSSALSSISELGVPSWLDRCLKGRGMKFVVLSFQFHLCSQGKV
jgi:hypothetical protein